VLLSLIVATTLAACNEQTDVAEPAPRPVRTVTLEKSEAGVPVVLTGRIEALETSHLYRRMSAVEGKADMTRTRRDVCL
jgi:multidrug efflux pump subunit AcrA (membrane-fusion protein)